MQNGTGYMQQAVKKLSPCFKARISSPCCGHPCISQDKIHDGIYDNIPDAHAGGDGEEAFELLMQNGARHMQQALQELPSGLSMRISCPCRGHLCILETIFRIRSG